MLKPVSLFDPPSARWSVDRQVGRTTFGKPVGLFDTSPEPHWMSQESVILSSRPATSRPPAPAPASNPELHVMWL